eukprot:gene9047-1365_t
MEEDIEEVIERAHRHVAMALQSPDDLAQVELLKLRAMRRRAGIEMRLKTAVQSQISDVQESSHLLQRCLADLEVIQSSIDDSEKLINGCEELVHHAAQARILSDSRNRIFNIPDDVQDLENILRDDDLNILLAHKKLMHLERCMEHVQEKLAVSSVRASDARAVDEYFKGVRIVSAKFQQLVFFLAHDPLALVKENPTLLVSTLRIIMREEKLDQKTAPSCHHRPKGLKQKYMEKLSLQIESGFDSKLFAHSSVSSFLDTFRSFYFSDLIIAQTKLPECFPPDIDIFQFYLRHYHDRLCFMTEQLIAHEDISPNEIIQLLNWVPEYKHDMKTKLSIDVSDLQQQLLGVEQDGLREKYLEMLQTKLREWTVNLATSDLQAWKGKSRNLRKQASQSAPTNTDTVIPEQLNERSTSPGDRIENGDNTVKPPLKVDGCYVTDTPPILFQMIDGQIDVALQKNSSREFAAQVLEHCYQSIKCFHVEYKKALHEVRELYCGEAPEPHPTYLVRLSQIEYIMAVINDMQRSHGYLEQMMDRIQGSYPKHKPEYTQAETIIQNELDPGFSQLALYSVDLLIDLMMRSRKTMRQVIATLDDYCSDFEKHLNSTALVQKRYRPKDELERDGFIKNFEDETDMLRKFFERFNVMYDSQGVNVYPTNLMHLCRNTTAVLLSFTGKKDPTMALTYIRQMLEASPSMITMAFLKMRSEFVDFTPHHLEAVILIREDFKPRDAKNLIRERITSKKRGRNDTPEPTHEEVQQCDFFVHVPVSQYSSKDYDDIPKLHRTLDLMEAMFSVVHVQAGQLGSHITKSTNSRAEACRHTCKDASIFDRYLQYFTKTPSRFGWKTTPGCGCVKWVAEEVQLDLETKFVFCRLKADLDLDNKYVQ